MLLPPEEATKFHSLYQSLLGFVCARIGGVDGVIDAESFRRAPTQRKAEARDLLYEYIDLIGAYVEENPDEFRELDLGIVLSWRRFSSGRFVIARDLRELTIFLTEGDPPRAYGVLGLNSEISEIIAQPLPAMVDTVLLPWKDRIVCDGLLRRYNIRFGPGMRRAMKERCDAAKASGIITSLDPDWRPAPPAEAKKPKNPAVSRFIKRCPKAVEDFKRRFGPPQSEVEGERAREYGLWQVDGAAVNPCDRVLIYPNVIADHDLHLFVRGGEITHIAAPPRRQWTKAELRPPEGGRLLR